MFGNRNRQRCYFNPLPPPPCPGLPFLFLFSLTHSLSFLRAGKIYPARFSPTLRTFIRIHLRARTHENDRGQLSSVYIRTHDKARKERKKNAFIILTRFIGEKAKKTGNVVANIVSLNALCLYNVRAEHENALLDSIIFR